MSHLFSLCSFPEALSREKVYTEPCTDSSPGNARPKYWATPTDLAITHPQLRVGRVKCQAEGRAGQLAGSSLQGHSGWEDTSVGWEYQ